jgi:hypothetical protein
MKHTALALSLIGTLALAARVNYSVIVNGQVSSERAIVVSGKTYVPLALLKSLGVSSSLKGTTLTLGNSSAGGSSVQTSSSVTPGGANQRAYLPLRNPARLRPQPTGHQCLPRDPESQRARSQPQQGADHRLDGQVYLPRLQAELKHLSERSSRPPEHPALQIAHEHRPGGIFSSLSNRVLDGVRVLTRTAIGTTPSKVDRRLTGTPSVCKAKGGGTFVDAFEDGWERRGTLHYRLCPRCFRAVQANSSERYCINDGSWLLEQCPLCSAPITNPYARYCATCGLEFAGATETAMKEE